MLIRMFAPRLNEFTVAVGMILLNVNYSTNVVIILSAANIPLFGSRSKPFPYELNVNETNSTNE